MLHMKSWKNVTFAWWLAPAVLSIPLPCLHLRWPRYGSTNVWRGHSILFSPQVAARGVPVAEFNMETTPATQRLGGHGFFFQVQLIVLIFLTTFSDNVSVHLSGTLWNNPTPSTCPMNLSSKLNHHDCDMCSSFLITCYEIHMNWIENKFQTSRCLCYQAVGLVEEVVNSRTLSLSHRLSTQWNRWYYCCWQFEADVNLKLSAQYCNEYMSGAIA